MDKIIKPAIYMFAGLLPGLIILIVLGCVRGEIGTREDQNLKLTYLGHAAFLIEEGGVILMDPYSPEMGYGKLDLEVDLITVSHNHFDHSYIDAAPGAVVLEGVDKDGNCNDILHHFAGFNIYNVACHHDSYEGGWLGQNSIFVVETYDFRLAHLGDLGHPLGEDELELLGEIDILLIPVGGYYTMSFEAILHNAEALAPSILVPMHYSTKHFPDRMLGTLEDFLALNPPYPVHHKGNNFELTVEDLPASTEIWVMDY